MGISIVSLLLLIVAGFLVAVLLAVGLAVFMRREAQRKDGKR